MLRTTVDFLGRRQTLTIGFLFSVGSLLLGIWVASLPLIKERLHFTDGSLGLSLLLAPLGSLTGVLLSSALFSRMPVGKWLVIGHCLLPALYIIQVTAPTRMVFWLALFSTGLVGFMNGVSANAVVDIVEKRDQKKIMSTCHGMYSLGGGISAGLAAIFYAISMPVSAQIAIVAVGIAFIIFVVLKKELLNYQLLIHSGAGLAAPPPAILGLAFICFTAFMGEGAIADWSAIYLREGMQTSTAVASLGFAGFSIMMAVGRFNGDTLIPKLGARKLVIIGSIVAALGYGIAIVAPVAGVAIAGFTLVGLGYACIVPVLFSAAANVRGVSPAMGISTVASGGLIGFLTGPSVIGIVSEKLNMATGLGFVLVLTLASTFVASRNRFLGANMESSFIELT